MPATTKGSPCTLLRPNIILVLVAAAEPLCNVSVVCTHFAQSNQTLSNNRMFWCVGYKDLKSFDQQEVGLGWYVMVDQTLSPRRPISVLGGREGVINQNTDTNIIHIGRNQADRNSWNYLQVLSDIQKSQISFAHTAKNTARYWHQ